MKLLDDVIRNCKDVTTLAEGGQKSVLAAVHSEFGPVVIKYGGYRSSATLERITREVQLLGELDSPYYPKHFEFLIEPVRREFVIVEERLDAVELTHAKERFDTDEKIQRLLGHMVSALSLIWERNVIHRDIKPANILVTKDDEPRVIDLGIARFLDDVSLTATLAGRGPGTPIYAAPEQLLNRKPMINVRTDFFLLGLLVLELMHGFHPFDPLHVGNGNDIVENIIEGKYVAADQNRSELLVGFVSRSLKRQPFKRFRTVDEVVEYLGMDRKAC